MDIKATQETVHDLAVAKGWWDAEKARGITTADVLAKLALIHSEVSEAVEEARITPVDELTTQTREPTGKPAGFAIELADAVIRILDLCGALEIDLGEAIRTKHEFNVTRTSRHGGKLA